MSRLSVIFSAIIFHLLLFMPYGSLFNPSGHLFAEVGASLGAYGLLLLPGYLLTWRYLDIKEMLPRFLLSAGSALAFLVITSLFISSAWLLLFFDLILLVLIFTSPTQSKELQFKITPALAFVTVIGIFFRFIPLWYSEYQGDEARALFFATDRVNGEPNALIQHKKGPVEILIPTSAIGVTDINKADLSEFGARLPFALYGVLVIPLTYVIARTLLPSSSNLYPIIAATIVALDGFLVAFSKIVQYQIPLLYCGLCSFLCALLLEQTAKINYPLIYLGFACITTALLGHYDAVLLVPLILAPLILWVKGLKSREIRNLILGLVLSLLVLSCFYIPFFLNPNFTATQSYLAARVGDGVNPYKNLYDYFSLLTFYNCTYFVGAVVLLLLYGGIISIKEKQVRILFAGIIPTFILYIFFVARPNTHFYPMHIPCALLAALPFAYNMKGTKKFLLSVFGIGAIFQLAYMYIAYVRTDPQYRTTYPKNRPAIFTAWYGDKLPKGAYFGFPIASGWEALARVFESGEFKGSYDSNEESLITEWYLKGSKRVSENPTYYFFVREPNDPVPLNRPKVERTYHFMGRVYVGDRPTIDVYSDTALPAGMEPKRIR